MKAKKKTKISKCCLKYSALDYVLLLLLLLVVIFVVVLVFVWFWLVFGKLSLRSQCVIFIFYHNKV